MRYIPIFAGILLLANFSGAEAAKVLDPIKFKPTTRWNVDFADEHCALHRSFGNGPSQIHIELRQYAPGEKFDLFIFGTWRGLDDKKFSYRFSSDSAARDGESRFRLELKDGLFGAMATSNWGPERPSEGQEYQFEVPPGTIEAWAASNEYILVGRPKKNQALLETGPLDDVRDVMAQCLDELVTHWGIDANAHKSLVQPAMPIDQAKWARKIQENYPISALTGDQVGPINILLLIDRDGKPTQCKAIASLTSKLLANTACDGLMKYGKFSPALDAKGEPISSYYATRVIYTIG